MPDAQIHPTGVEPTPARYLVPQSAELLLKGVFAKFDGSGAAGDFQPLLRIISDAGSTSIEAVSDTTVTAGASADATWFPRVGGQAKGATSTTLAFARAWNDSFSGDAAQLVPAGTATSATFAHTETTNASIISFSTAIHTNDLANLNVGGTYIMYVGSQWSIGGNDVTSEIFGVGGTENAFPHLPIQPTGNPLFFDGIGNAQSQDFVTFHKSSGGGLERVSVSNRDVADQLVTSCYFVIVYLGTG